MAGRCLLTFAGVGLRLDIRAMLQQGVRPFVVGAANEAVMAVLTLGLVVGASRITHF